MKRVFPKTTLLPIALLAAGCSEQTTTEVEVVPAVSAAPVESVDLVEEIRASGELKALFHTNIAAEIEGRITEIRVEEGGAVNAGSVVIAIDPERRELDKTAAEARLAKASAELRKQQSQTARIRRLRDEDIASEQQIEEAETALLLARANVEAERANFGVAERALADANVSAPFAGYIARRNVQLGEFVQKGTELFELVSLEWLEVEFSIPEFDAVRAHEGMEVSIEVSAWPGRRFTGVVNFVSPTIDPQTRTLRIRAQINNADNALRPGLFARVSLGISQRTGVAMVPESALIQRTGSATLFKLLPDLRVQRVEVETGSLQNGLIEIRGDVQAGERIVARGHSGLVDGAVVRLLEPPVAPPAVAAGSTPTSSSEGETGS